MTIDVPAAPAAIEAMPLSVTDLIMIFEVVTPPFLLIVAAFLLGYFWRKREERREMGDKK